MGNERLDRVERMESDGLISKSQADMLRRAVGGASKTIAKPQRRLGNPMILLALGGAVVIALARRLAARIRQHRADTGRCAITQSTWRVWCDE